MTKKSLYILIIITAFVLTAGYLLKRPAHNYLSDYLSKSEQVNANILIVEGWLPDYATINAYEEFRKNGYDYIITTGLNSIIQYFMLSMHGYLIFYPTEILSNGGNERHHIIDIEAYSELGGDNRAHFNLFINDSLVGDFLAIKRRKKYRINWEGNIKDIDSIIVQFTRNGIGVRDDQHLYVKEVIIDDSIKIPYLNNTEYDIGALDGKNRMINNFNSLASLTRNRLLALSLDSSLIMAIPARKVRINKTLTSALAFRDWLNTTDIDIKGINIMSLGTHARRTWMTYNKILNEKYEVGIISIPDKKYSKFTFRNLFFTIRETLGILYYWIILIPY